ncbi:helix-turn-helix domain-containing protein [Streptomyces sp. CA-288835]|uniref:helix-turn-helix domain-containing protein n=1 Tax=Streptomyces sp. CA-288835 TaxID=3240069 RepID=UPI003D9109AF
MARRMRPVAADSPPALAKLASELRELRSNAALSLRELSEATRYSPASLSRAFSGQALPGPALVRRIVEACQGDTEHFDHLWRTAAKERSDRESPSTDQAESLLAAISELYNQAGRPSLRELANQTGQARSTLQRALTSPTSTSWERLEALSAAMLTQVTPQQRDSRLRAIRQLWVEAHQPAGATENVGEAVTELHRLVAAIEEAQQRAVRSEYRLQALTELLQEQQSEMRQLTQRIRELEEERDALTLRSKERP